MKDYIYPLHNVTLDIALGEERSVGIYSPNAASDLLSQQGKNKVPALLVASHNQNKHR